MSTLSVDLNHLKANPTEYNYFITAFHKAKLPGYNGPFYIVDSRGAYVGDRDVLIPKGNRPSALWVPEITFETWLREMFARRGRSGPFFAFRQIALKAMPAYMRGQPASAPSTPPRAGPVSPSATQRPVSMTPSRFGLVSSATHALPITPSRAVPVASAPPPPPITPDTPELSSPSQTGSDDESDTEGEEEEDEEGSDMELDEETDDGSAISRERSMSRTPAGSIRRPVTLSRSPSEISPCNFTAYLADLFAPVNKKKRKYEDEDDVLDSKRRCLEERSRV